jgi:hypothetical protein
VQVSWDLSIAAVNAETCTYTNRVVSYPTRGLLELLDRAGRTFEETAAGLQQATTDHNRRETTQYPASTQRKALAECTRRAYSTTEVKADPYVHLPR